MQTDAPLSTRQGLAYGAMGLPLAFVALPLYVICLLYTSDAADDLLCVDLGGRRIIKKKPSSQHFSC